ncbi:2,3-bisphosphoglycerate-independent phosphoglycerate mutase-like [Periplaneta americana]|uniref:2,3-bisphosphoglycerate-independent phosphoglycerate mutase-like n=1 Tax=Periplaneta americana TaxID=6978 RepID=UPI0037E99AA8
MQNTNKVALIILDGLGLSEQVTGNAVKQAKMPTFNTLWKKYPHSELLAKGLSVGLPPKQMGNSEVGHLNIGAGRIVFQSLTQIDNSILNGEFFKNPALLEAMLKAKNEGKSLHLLGLVSHGGVHSSITHLYALLEMAKQVGLEKVYIHSLLDGRDTAMRVALDDITELEAFLKALGIGKIASVAGRFYGMDRDKNYDRTQKFYNSIVLGEGIEVHSASKAIQDAYEQGETDEFLKPRVIVDSVKTPVGLVQNGDSVILFNFRPDRVRQISQALGLTHFNDFPHPPLSIFLTTLTEYHRDFTFPIAFKQQELSQTLGEVLQENKISQLRAAETEKYAHVTFFFNAMKEEPYSLEHRILTPSLKVETYDLAPQMSAKELTQSVVQKIQEENIQFLLLNYANPDMVGHSGKLDAVIKALETVDACLRILLDTLQKQDFDILITADHGNAEQMIDSFGNPCKTHTFSPVPFIFVPSLSKFKQTWEIQNGILADLAPTILYLFGIPKPQEMTGNSLLRSI